MSGIRRKGLQGLETPGHHAGLALTHLLSTHDEPAGKEMHPYTDLVASISSLTLSPIYEKAFERWKNALKDAVTLEATTTGPLAIGLGNASPIENGLSIHHTYGTPYLPGSAIKGLMRRAADKYGLSDQEKGELFGVEPDIKRKSQGSAAHLVYWDGWLDPSSNQPFQRDVITVHHPSYYQGGKEWPTDFDDPNPVAFLSVKPGTKFCLALSSTSENSSEWVLKAAELLKWSLENLGLGGKTNAGYGYFGEIKIVVAEKPKTPQQQALNLLERKRPIIEQIQNAQDLSKADALFAEVSEIEPIIRQPVLEALKLQLQKIKRWDLEKARCQRIQALLEES